MLKHYQLEKNMKKMFAMPVIDVQQKTTVTIPLEEDETEFESGIERSNFKTLLAEEIEGEEEIESKQN